MTTGKELVWEKVKPIYNWLIKTPKRQCTGIVIFLALVLICFYFIREAYLETKGDIIVDEPKVYSRERLVNDRFREEAWLNEQLTKPKRDDFLSPEARMSSVKTQQLALAANATKSDGSKTEQDQHPIQPDVASLEKASQNIAISPVDTFSDMLDYRDKVRNELMRIQLDDRHDIEGNTLYRLNFDTAIIPGDHTHASAAILVTITPDDKANGSKDNQEAVFKEWTGQMQTLVNSLITDKTNLFRNATDPDASVLPDEQAAFEGFLRNNICNEVKNLSKKLFDIKHENKAVPPDWENLCPKTEESDYEQNESNSQISKPDLFYNCNNHKTQFFCEVEKLIGSYSVNYDRTNKSESSSSYIEYLKKNFPRKEVGDSIEFYKDIQRACNPNAKNVPLPELVYYNSKSRKFFPDLPTFNESKRNGEVPQTIYCLKSLPANRIVIVMGLLERLNRVSTIEPSKLVALFNKPCPDPDKKVQDKKNENCIPVNNKDFEKIEIYPRVIEELARPYFSGKIDMQDPFILPQDKYWYIASPIKGIKQNNLAPEYPIDNGLHQTQNNIKQLMVTYQATKLNKLGEYFTSEVAGCDMQNCNLVLNANPGAHIKLMEALNDVTQTFSYAVTPQLQTQRIALLNKQKEQLNVRVNAALLGGDNKAESMVEKLTNLEDELEILENHPLVIGFGDWQYQKKYEPNAEATQHITRLNKEIDWLDKLIHESLKQSIALNDNSPQQEIKISEKKLETLRSKSALLTKKIEDLQKEFDTIKSKSTEDIALFTKQKEDLQKESDTINSKSTALLNDQIKWLNKLVHESTVSITPLEWINNLINAPSKQSIDLNTSLKEQVQTKKSELEKLESKPNTETRFGWVIKPRLTGMRDSLHNSEFVQLAGHYSLSAVISIPSWWHAIKVQVKKCWLTEPKLGTIISTLCTDSDSDSPSFTIKVPGQPHDINQKLGFEVVKSPRLSPRNYYKMQKQAIEIGRKGVVRLEGERLWRSTVVMLDDQKADNIEVLPDMKAVMATFQCVKPPAGDTMKAYIEEKNEKKQAGAITSGANNAEVSFKVSLNSLISLLSPLEQKTKEAEPPKSSGSKTITKDQSLIIDSSQENCNPNGQEGDKPQDICSKFAMIRLWTSEGNTDNNPLPVDLKPFIKRYPSDLPCYQIEAEKEVQAIQIN